jgi:hypothetical protein
MLDSRFVRVYIVPQASQIPDAHKQVVADYYRRLGETDQ